MFLPEEYSFEQKDYRGITRTIRINSLDFIIEDNPGASRVKVFLKGFVKPLILWDKEDYFIAGDYTQQQVEDRILELLSPDIKRSLWNLSNFLPYTDNVIPEPQQPQNPIADTNDLSDYMTRINIGVL